MREGWEYKTIEKCTSIEYGTRVVQKRDGGTIYPVYGGGGETFRMDRYNREDCLIIARFAMSPRCVRYVAGKFFLNDSGLSVKSKEELEQAYLNYHLLFFNDVIYHLGKGAAQRNLDVKAFRQLVIAIPPKPTQLSIVSELDKLNELIQIKKVQLKDYDALAQSIFYEMFGDPVENEKGWEVMSLADVCHSITDGDHMPPPKTDSGIPFLTISNINKETRILDFSDTFFVPQSYYVALKESRKPMENDLLYTVTGSYGIPVVVDGKNSFCFQRHIALLRPNVDKVLTLYLCYWCLCPSIKQVADKVATGIAQKTVSLTSLRKFSIILPPLPLQQSFAHRIEQIERQKAAVQRTIKDLETLLAVRMQYWFE